MSAMNPTVETSPVALRISLTDQCALRCLYCRPQPGPAGERSRAQLTRADILRFVTVARATLGVAKVRLTGGEPLLRADLLDIVAALAGLGLPDLALTTNGQALAALAAPLRAAGLGRINVSLDSLAADTFAHMRQGGELALTLQGIDAALAAGLAPVRINTVVMRGINDHEVDAIVDFALARGCEPRFIELMPSGLAPADFQRWFVPSAEVRTRLARRYPLVPEAYVPGSSSRRFAITTGAGTGHVGFISPGSHPFCAGCRRLRLTADGRLLGCLGRREHVGLLGLLREPGPEADQRIASALHVALEYKRGAGVFAVAMPMSMVGG
jgi:cyclic pyranopterin phosphate synthase